MRVMTISDMCVITIDDVDPTLAWLQSQVGGYIEPVDVSGAHHGDGTIYVNEEGKLTGMTRNLCATRLAHHFGAIYADDWVAGTCVLLGPVDDNGDHLELGEPLMRETLRVIATRDTPPLRVAPTYWQAVAEMVYEGVPVIPTGAPGDLFAEPTS